MNGADPHEVSIEENASQLIRGLVIEDVMHFFDGRIRHWRRIGASSDVDLNEKAGTYVANYQSLRQLLTGRML